MPATIDRQVVQTLGQTLFGLDAASEYGAQAAELWGSSFLYGYMSRKENRSIEIKRSKK
jgi:hypothetical protein